MELKVLLLGINLERHLDIDAAVESILRDFDTSGESLLAWMSLSYIFQNGWMRLSLQIFVTITIVYRMFISLIIVPSQ